MMYSIRYNCGGWVDEYATKEAWESELEDIAENTPFDIDIVSDYCAIIDNGDE